MEWVGKRKKLQELISKKEIPKMELWFTNGHILKIKWKEDWKKESLGIDLQTYRPKYSVIQEKKQAIVELWEKIKRADEVIVMTDSDYEWEVIAFCLYAIFPKEKHKFKRAISQEISWPSINKALENLTDSYNQNNVDAGMIRAVLDRLIGWTYSSVVYKKWDWKLTNVSAWRCQSPTLKFLTEREREIRNFVPKDFYGLHVLLDCDIKASHVKNKTINKDESICFSKTELEGLLDKLKDVKEATVISTEDSIFETNPKEPFNNASFLSSCASILWLSAESITKIWQELYEAWYVSYIRTDAVELEPEKIAEIRDYIKSCYWEENLPEKPIQYKNPESAQASHMAIAPVNLSVSADDITAELWYDHWRVYELIFKRAVASQMPPVKTNKQKVILDIAWETFVFSAKQVVYDGFRMEWSYSWDTTEDDEEGSDFIKVSEWETLDVKKIFSTEHKTKAPSRYNVWACVTKMDKLRIGRPATIPAIIKLLEEREYISIGKKSVISVTPKWEEVMDIINDFAWNDIMDFDYTKNLEDKRDDISKGKITYNELAEKFFNDVKETIGKFWIFIDDEGFVQLWSSNKKAEDTWEKCPLCRDWHLLKFNTDKWMWITCTNGKYSNGKRRGCEYFNFFWLDSVATWKKCPVVWCNGELYVITTKNGKKIEKCMFSYYDKSKWTLWCQHPPKFL